MAELAQIGVTGLAVMGRNRTELRQAWSPRCDPQSQLCQD